MYAYLRSAITTSVMLVAIGSGCGHHGGLGDTPTLSGQIEGWSGGAGLTLTAFINEMKPAIASAPIEADGRFSITLPGRDAVVSFLKSSQGSYEDLCASKSSDTVSCQSSVSPESAMFGTLALAISSTGAVRREQRVPSPQFPSFFLAVHSVQYQYWDRSFDYSIKRVQRAPSSPSGTTTLSVEQHFEPGWNVSILRSNQTDPVGTSLTTEIPSDEFKWYAQVP